MPIVNGGNVKDILLTTLAILNDEMTANEILPSICCCFNKFCSQLSFASKLKPFLIFETFVSLRIFIGVTLHLIELCILMDTADSSNFRLALGFSLPICVCLLVLLGFLIVYDIFLARRISRGDYKKDFDTCCLSTKEFEVRV